MYRSPYGHTPVRYPLCVLQRVLDMNVSVEADGAEVDDRRCGAHHVGADPDLAENLAEFPSGQVVQDGEGHH